MPPSLQALGMLHHARHGWMRQIPSVLEQDARCKIIISFGERNVTFTLAEKTP
jgi:hypothetical protein